MKHRNSHLLVGYWSRIRREREIPDQCDIDPRAIKRMLSQVFILDASDAARPTYRLAGTWLCDRFGFELKGTSFLANWDAQSRNTLLLLLKQSLATRQPACISSIGATTDCTMVEIETVIAPLSFGSDKPTRFLGMVQFLGDSGALVAPTIAYQRMVGSVVVREDESGPADPPPPRPPADVLRTHPRAPHLRLVVSRGGPATVHCEMDEAMCRLIAALEITKCPQLSLLGG